MQAIRRMGICLLHAVAHGCDRGGRETIVTTGLWNLGFLLVWELEGVLREGLG